MEETLLITHISLESGLISREDPRLKPSGWESGALRAGFPGRTCLANGGGATHSWSGSREDPRLKPSG